LLLGGGDFDVADFEEAGEELGGWWVSVVL